MSISSFDAGEVRSEALSVITVQMGLCGLWSEETPSLEPCDLARGVRGPLAISGTHWLLFVTCLCSHGTASASASDCTVASGHRGTVAPSRGHSSVTAVEEEGVGTGSRRLHQAAMAESTSPVSGDGWGDDTLSDLALSEGEGSQPTRRLAAGSVTPTASGTGWDDGLSEFLRSEATATSVQDLRAVSEEADALGPMLDELVDRSSPPLALICDRNPLSAVGSTSTDDDRDGDWSNEEGCRGWALLKATLDELLVDDVIDQTPVAADADVSTPQGPGLAMTPDTVADKAAVELSAMEGAQDCPVASPAEPRPGSTSTADELAAIDMGIGTSAALAAHLFTDTAPLSPHTQPVQGVNQFSGHSPRDEKMGTSMAEILVNPSEGIFPVSGKRAGP